MSNISEWSSTANNNNSGAPDGFPEGMNPSGVNNAAREVMAAVRRQYEDAEWIDYGDTPTYASTTSFTVAGDLTSRYSEGRKLKITDSSTLYGVVASSSYSSPNTTVTVTLDTGSISASISDVALGLISSNSALHRDIPRSKETVAKLQADVANFNIGDTVYIEERGAYFKCVAYSSPDGYSKVDGDGSTKMFSIVTTEVMTSLQFGAVPGVASDQQPALEAAKSYCSTNGVKLVVCPDGSNKYYQIDDTVTFASDDLKVEFINGAYLKPVDNTLLQPCVIGGTSQPTRMEITGLLVDRGSYSGATENTGITFLEMNACHIESESRYSKYNNVFSPTVGGCAHNVFIGLNGVGGYYNYWMTEMGSGGETGYVNENEFVGGRGFCTSDTNTNFRVDGGTAPYGTGHNRISMSLEGQGVQAIYDNGASNKWDQCRTEGTWSSGYGHVYGPDCQWPLVISSRYDYTIDRSGATAPLDTIISYKHGILFSNGNNTQTVLTLENLSASAGCGIDIDSYLDASTQFAWRARRNSDKLVRASCTVDGRLTVAKQLINEQSGYTFDPLVLGTDHFYIDGNYLRHAGAVPSAATDGRIMMENQTSVAAGLGNIANVVNTTDKYTGKMVFDTGTNKPVWSTGTTAGSVWVYADGTTAYTPA